MSESAADSTLLDLRGLRCPLPVLRVRKALGRAAPGATLIALSDDPLSGVDIPNFVRENGDALVSAEPSGNGLRFVIRRGDAHPPEPDA